MGNCLKSPTSDDISLLHGSENVAGEGSSSSDQMIGADSLPQIEEAPPMFFPSPSVSRPVSQLTEEEQVKIAKRMGLITHLPCGIFDGTKKSGECVICMIDFTVGDRVRYLPCMHTYHTECIDDWLMRSFTCPSCLEPVDAALLNTYGSS